VCATLRPRGAQLRDGERRDPQDGAFERRRHRARVGHVVTDVAAAIDPRDEQVGLTLEHAQGPEIYAIGGRAVDGVDPVVDLPHCDRPMERQRVTGRTLFSIRRDDGHVAKRSQGIGQRVQSR